MNKHAAVDPQQNITAISAVRPKIASTFVLMRLPAIWSSSSSGAGGSGSGGYAGGRGGSGGGGGAGGDGGGVGGGGGAGGEGGGAGGSGGAGNGGNGRGGSNVGAVAGVLAGCFSVRTRNGAVARCSSNAAREASTLSSCAATAKVVNSNTLKSMLLRLHSKAIRLEGVGAVQSLSNGTQHVCNTGSAAAGYATSS